MKTRTKLFILLLLGSLLACSDDSTSPREQNIVWLTAQSWGHAHVNHETDGNLSSQYSNFAILFTAQSSQGYDGTFMISHGGNAFAEATGMWRFNSDLTKLILNSGQELNFQLEADHLQLDFYVADPGGRSSGLSGHFVFELSPL
ncbi:MAG: hypothetical protein ACOYXT_12375 [Bacteroidota bacterium]